MVVTLRCNRTESDARKRQKLGILTILIGYKETPAPILRTV